MRLDICDETWHPAFIGHVKAYCDGVEVKDVAAADEENGWVRHLALDGHGRAIKEDDGESLKEEFVYGDVEIVFDKPPEELKREHVSGR